MQGDLGRREAEQLVGMPDVVTSEAVCGRQDRGEGRTSATLQRDGRIDRGREGRRAVREERVGEVGLEVRPRRLAERVRPEGAEFPVRGVRAEAGANGIHGDIDADGPRRVPVGHGRRVEAPAEDVIGPAVSTVVRPRVAVADEPEKR